MQNETYYGLGGNIVEESAALAKTVETTSQTKYFFIIEWKGTIFNPYGSYSLKRSDRQLCKFRKVTEQCFRNYVHFLKSKNQLYYTRSQREATQQA